MIRKSRVSAGTFFVEEGPGLGIFGVSGNAKERRKALRSLRWAASHKNNSQRKTPAATNIRNR